MQHRHQACKEMQWRSPDQVGLSSQKAAYPSVSSPRGQALQGRHCWLEFSRAPGPTLPCPQPRVPVTHSLTWPELCWGEAWRFPGDICASEAPGSGTNCGSGFPVHRALDMCLCSFHCCSGQASHSSFHFIKRASAPPPAS